MSTLDIDFATPYETGPKQLHDVGQRAETPNGDVFRYVKMGAAVGVANKLYQGSIAVAFWNSVAHTVALAVGDTEISFTDGGTALTAGEAEGGNIIPELGTDLGHIYRVKSNIATDTNVTVCQLEDGVTVQNAVATGGSRVLTFIKSPYMDILIHPATTPTAVVVGVPRVIIAIAGFGWVQRRGVTSILSSGTPVVGQKVIAGTAVGSVIEGVSQTTNIKNYIGTCMTVATATDFGSFNLELE